MKYRVLIGLFVLVFNCRVFAGNDQVIPTKAFFEHYQFSNVEISPNGKYLAVVGPVKGEENQTQIDVVELSDNQVRAHFTLGEQQEASGLWWATNSQLLFTTDYRYGWFDQPISTGDVWVLNINSGNVSKVAIDTSVSRVIYREGGKKGYVQVREGRFMEFDEDEKYAAKNMNEKWAYLAKDCAKQYLYVKPSGAEVHSRNDGETYDDNQGNARIWVGYNELTYKAEMAYSNPCDKQMRWYDISKFIAQEPEYTYFEPWLFTADNSKFYYAGITPAGTTGLYLVDPEKNWEKHLLYEDPEYDIGSPYFSYMNWLVSDDGMSLLAFEYMADGPRWILIDQSAPQVRLLAKLEKIFNGQNVVLTSRTVDGKLTVVYVSSDRNPGSYYLYDSKSNKTTFLFKVLPGIKPDLMASMQPISFKARDGVVIHGYLTLPVRLNKNLPLIVHPHGGPFGVRDQWGFDPEVQYLAYHGYAVLQVEFRGSGGYGHAFQEAGYRQWGGRMQDDLTDATYWAIHQGIADPNRICIYGASYGGYAALEGVVKNPDLYKCAVGYAGIYDLEKFRSHFNTLHYRAEIPAESTVLGDDETYLKDHSPVLHVDKIKAALFLAHGGFDQTVSIDQADELKDALDETGKKYEWVYYRTESHGFYKLDHRVYLYDKMLAFFDKHIGSNRVAH